VAFKLEGWLPFDSHLLADMLGPKNLQLLIPVAVLLFCLMDSKTVVLTAILAWVVPIV
jgi:hypothetical protein